MPGADDKFRYFDWGALTGPVPGPPPAGVTDFLSLDDTPDSYVGQALLGVRVKADESGLEFSPTASGSFQPLDADLTAIAALSTQPFGRGSLEMASDTAFRAYIGAGDGTWANLTGKPTTLAGYGITDAQPLDADLTAIAALTTTAFGRGFLTQADAASSRTYIGAGSSNFSGAFIDLTGKPTTLAGYGITDAQPLDGDLTSLAAATATNTMYYRSGAGVWSIVTIGTGITFTAGILSATGGGVGTVATVFGRSGDVVAQTGDYSFAQIGSKPTTLSGYGITDAQPLDADLTAIAVLTTTGFGRGFLTQADAASSRTYIGAGDGTFSGLTGKPTTLAGYGITDAQPLDSDLTAIAALTTSSYGRGFLPLADAAAARAYIGATAGGDFSSNTSTSVDSEIMLFSGTTGKLGKRATGSGIVKATAGVYSIAVTRVDYWDASTFGASGVGHAKGLVPDPGTTAGTTHYLREDASWVTLSMSSLTDGQAIADLANSTALSLASITFQDISGQLSEDQLPSSLTFNDLGEGGFLHFDETQGRTLLLVTIGPVVLTGDETDFNPTGLSYVDDNNPGAFTVEIDCNGAQRLMHGIAGGFSGRMLRLTNVSSTDVDLILKNQSATCPVANDRFSITANVLRDMVVHRGHSAVLRYARNNRWRPYGTSMIDTGVVVGTYTNATISVLSDGRITAASTGTGGAAAWGSITGTLSAQTDLQAALDAKQPLDAQLTSLAALTFTASQYIRVNAGGTGFELAAVSATPGGSDKQIQFNDSTVFGGDSGLTWDKLLDLLTVTTSLASNTKQDGLILANSAPATNGNQQYPPYMQFAGSGWRTTGAGARSVQWEIGIPINQGTSEPTSNLEIRNSTGGVSFNTRLKIFAPIGAGGGAVLGTDTNDPGNGVFNATVGFQQGGTALLGYVLRGDGTKFVAAQLAGSDLLLSDVTTNNASTSAHGFCPKLSGTATTYLDGTGVFSTPAAGGGGGNVSNSGTPTANQFARWTDATHIAGVALVASHITDANTVGQAFVTLTNPGAITFPKVNADNSVTAESAATHRTSLGLAIGTNVQAFDADLDNLAAITGNSKFAFRNSSGVWQARGLGTGLTDDGTNINSAASANAFGTFSVSGQSDVVADASPDTLTFVKGPGIDITTDASTDTITIGMTNPDFSILALALLGSAIKGQTQGGYGPSSVQSTVALADGTARYFLVYLPVAATITGLKWFQVVQGNYVADNNNYLALYSYSAGTLTQVAISANDGNIWKATANTWVTTAFTATYAAAAGVYYAAFLYNSTSQTTAPTVGGIQAMQGNNVGTFDFTNSAKVTGTVAAQTALPSPTQAMSGISAGGGTPYVAVY